MGGRYDVLTVGHYDDGEISETSIMREFETRFERLFTKWFIQQLSLQDN